MRTPARRRRLPLVAVILALVASTVGATQAHAAEPTDPQARPAGGAGSTSGWVVVRYPEQDHTPFPRDRGNSTGGLNWVDRSSKGVYWVALPGLSATSIVQITPMGSQPRRCTLGWRDWEAVPARVLVRCYTFADKKADSRFVVTFTGGSGEHAGPRRLAYYYVADPDGPNPEFQYSSAGGTITVRELANTRDHGVIPGVGTPKGAGTVQVTSHLGATCRVVSWSGAPDLVVRVQCRTATGTPIRDFHHVLFMRNVGPEGFGGGPSAYLLADRPTARSYKPAKATAWATNGKRATIKRLSKGVYRVTLPGMPTGGAALVTPYGSGKQECQVGSIRIGNKKPQQVVVRCFTVAGKPTDGAFTLAYTK